MRNLCGMFYWKSLDLFLGEIRTILFDNFLVYYFNSMIEKNRWF